MGGERDEKGLFQKGNAVGKKRERKPSIFQEARSVSKEGVAQSVIDLFEKPYATLKEDLKRPEATRFEYILAKAISMNNTKFIQWAIEWVGGRALQMTVNKVEGTPVREIVRPDGTVVKYHVQTNVEDAIPAECKENNEQD